MPSSRDVPDSGIEPVSLMSPALAGGLFTTEPPGNPERWVSPDLVSRLYGRFQLLVGNMLKKKKKERKS